MTFSLKDPVHGWIELPSYTKEIIASSTFQRLRNLKQLGVSNYYYKNATHSRYEHSIGTSFIAQSLLNILEKNSNIKIDDKLKKCVILAALMHDIGHGAFSHLWEDCVHQGNDNKWTHEDQSVKLIKYMICNDKIKLDDDVQSHEWMLEFICSLIVGNAEAWLRLLKPSQYFLTEIVSNKLCNIDVDKCDYLCRDYYYVKLKCLPFMDFLNRAKIVCDVNFFTHIGYHADDFYLIENMFKNRAKYHDKVYQLPQVSAAERQLKDICILADKAGFKMMGLRITEIQQNCEIYNQLDDTILDLIRNEKTICNDIMMKAQELIRQLDNDKFYINIYETKDKDEADYIYGELKGKFGDVFVKVKKVIPNANVPKNIPLYNNDGLLVKKLSEHNLEYESTLIYCTAFDDTTVKNVKNYLNKYNNNNNDEESA
ncbi:hypothetical protein PVAND_008040 [Polypedilum vanderplanki]|uniref:HD/PDEase domain-containing protein n=1 Tax=Polypedilum vanderplanki TaxID=319348 RepID=A0A9J6C9P4_POLVA|nr:hypothetical protein PVAND_008040 [Polypedilum vanderplanki]